MAVLFSTTLNAEAGQIEDDLVWSVSDPHQLKWQIVNDTVMGGVSSSQFKKQGDFGVFIGTLSLENGGGFASVRSVPREMDLPGTIRKFVVRVRGDGRTYKLTARRNGSFDGVNYQHAFETVAGKWQEVELKLANFQPRWRGRDLDEPVLRAPDIQSIGFIVADKKSGPFRLEIDWIRTSQ